QPLAPSGPSSRPPPTRSGAPLGAPARRRALVEDGSPLSIWQKGTNDSERRPRAHPGLQRQSRVPRRARRSVLPLPVRALFPPSRENRALRDALSGGGVRLRAALLEPSDRRALLRGDEHPH